MRLTRRIFLYFFGIFFILIVSIGFFQFRREREFRSDQLDTQLTTYNITVNQFIERNGAWNYNSLERLVKLFPDSTLRVTVIDKKGGVLFDSSVKDNLHLENHLHRPEIIDATRHKTGKAIRKSSTTHHIYYYLAQNFPKYYIRSALPYNVTLVEMLRTNHLFIYFIAIIMLVTGIAIYMVTRNITSSIVQLRNFTHKVETGDVIDAEPEFPNDELGEISKNMVTLYRQLIESKNDVLKEREKLIKHLQISHEGLAIFSSAKKEILANSLFIQYTNILSDKQSDKSEEIFLLPELADINIFIVQNQLKNHFNRKKILVEKNGYVFSIQCFVFQDDSFEITINDVSVTEHDNELKRQLTQNISHELKTPVSSILGYMESILNNPDMEPERKQFFIERSYQQAHRLSSLLQDISILNKLDETNQLYERTECNISEIITDMLSDVQLLIEQRLCTVVRNYKNPIIVSGNRSLLYSIFRNLIDNALAYAGTGTTIEINCYREDEQYFYFSFSDDGLGVEEKHLNKLFERFYRVDKGRSRKMGGTGLGLSIVKNAVLYHKGNISAKNNPNGGLSFLFTISKA